MQDLSASDVVRLLDTQTFFDLLGRPYPTTQEAVIAYLEDEHLIEQGAQGYAILNIGALQIGRAHV